MNFFYPKTQTVAEPGVEARKIVMGSENFMILNLHFLLLVDRYGLILPFALVIFYRYFPSLPFA